MQTSQITQIGLLVLALSVHRATANDAPGWKNLNWGAALEKVREHYPTIEEMKRPEGSTSFWYLNGYDAETGEFKPEGKWRIEFFFSESGGLRSVEYTIRNASSGDFRIAESIREKLAMQYGRPALDEPREHDSRVTIWRTPRAAIRLKWSAFPPIKSWSVGLTYSSLDNAANL